MNLTASQKATLNFYQWEARGRGWSLFETPVDIEPPYEQFEHKRFSNEVQIDDGRLPNLLDGIKRLIDSSKQTVTQTIPNWEIIPQSLAPEDVPMLTGFSLVFEKDQEIRSEVFVELIGMLSFTIDPISFEIIGTSQDITIQLVCSGNDKEHLFSYVKAYFPTIILKEVEPESFGFYPSRDVAISDFGLSDLFMQPIRQAKNFAVDPLTSLIANMEYLEPNEILVFQVLFKGVTAPWARDIISSVSDGQGGSFFADAPEVLSNAQEKTSYPLFSTVMRIATQGENNERSEYLATGLLRSITSISTSEQNKLIPLSNEGYNYDFHFFNLHHRTSNRLGFIVNSKELATFVHYPNRTVVSNKLGLQGGKTKAAPREYINQKYIFGINHHNTAQHKVGYDDQARLRHTHIIGATGVGKSTLIANMILEDMKLGNGCCLFDPHGDIVDDVLVRIPRERISDVILIDPANLKFPIGFNLLHATTEAEKIVLSSDLVSAFKRYATSWGDNMTAVLQQAVIAFLESNKGGTLIELKRFLLEDDFRTGFLKSVEDPAIHYYWQHEYKMVRKGIAPLLTRIDTFLRPKTIRYMLAQREGVDFRACIKQKKIVLIKLSQGLIGEDNSFLLGSLFLSKLSQATLGRQSVSKHQRHPYYVYCDEFQNFVTNSITSILSGARKYGLGLILAHQELFQIDDPKVLNSVLSNPNTRICFRLGDVDAKKLESGFSYFDQQDLQSLGVGQAIVRIGSSNNDFNIATARLSELDESTSATIKELVIKNTRHLYSSSREEVERILNQLLPKQRKFSISKKESSTKDANQDIKVESTIVVNEVVKREEHKPISISKKQRENLIREENESTEIRMHTYLQNMIKKLGQDRNYRALLEHPTKDGGRIDVVLEQENIKIGFEISETNKAEYELTNIKKCLDENCDYVVVVSRHIKHLAKIKEVSQTELTKKELKLVYFAQPEEVAKFLDEINSTPTRRHEMVKGFKVLTEYESQELTNKSSIKSQLIRLFKKGK